MPNLIIQHFEPLCQFLMPLLLQLSEPQQRHALNVVGALLVCGSKHKTLTTLTAMLRLPHADHFALADFFRQSGGCPVDVRRAVLTTQMATLARVVQTGETARLPLFLSVDDSLAVKDVATRALEAVSFHHDHVKQRRQSRNYTNAVRYVTVSAQVNGLSGSSVSTYWRALSRQRIKRVTVNNTQGSHIYHTRYTTGRLRGVPQPVGAVFSKRSPRKGPVAFFVTSDLRLRAQAILRYYASRWQAETDNFLLKQRLGLADFRLHSVEAVLRWFAPVFAACAFIRVHIAEARLQRPDRSPPSFHDVIAEQQRWHLEHLIVFVADQARPG